MTKRQIIEIDEDKCDGCGLCVPNCHEGALQIVDGKAKLVNEVYCDGLGNCLGHCPQNAIKIIEKDVKDFDFKKTNKHLKKIGKKELKENPLESISNKKNKNNLDNTKTNNKGENMNNKKPDLPCGCPGTMMRDLRKESKKENLAKNNKENNNNDDDNNNNNNSKQDSELKQWPIQLNLLPPNAPFFQDADLLIAADCVGFANPNLHKQLIKDKAIVIGCPKLDDINEYKEKIKEIIELNDLNTITVAIMEVPCCYGLYQIVEEALDESKKRITLKKVVIGVDGSKN